MSPFCSSQYHRASCLNMAQSKNVQKHPLIKDLWATVGIQEMGDVHLLHLHLTGFYLFIFGACIPWSYSLWTKHRLEMQMLKDLEKKKQQKKLGESWWEGGKMVWAMSLSPQPELPGECMPHTQSHEAQRGCMEISVPAEVSSSGCWKYAQV